MCRAEVTRGQVGFGSGSILIAGDSLLETGRGAAQILAMEIRSRWSFRVLRWLVYPALLLPAVAATLTLSSVADTSLFEGNPDSNLGGTSLVSGMNQRYSRSRALFRFDLAALPAGSLVTGAEVLLSVSKRPDPDQHGGPTNTDFSLYRLLASWGEGVGSIVTGSAAAPGDATWNERRFGSEGWANPGGLIGVDFAEAASATTFVSGLDDYVWGSSAALVADVQLWLAEPGSNHGYMLISQGEGELGSGRRFGSTEDPGGLVLPAQLRVTYSVVPEPAVAGLAGLGLAGLVMLRFRRP